MIEVEKGWRFMSADFSVQAHGKIYSTGAVILIRDPEEREKWSGLSDEDREDENGPPLYVVGHGLTIEDAFMNANRAARRAKPIKTTKT